MLLPPQYAHVPEATAGGATANPPAGEDRPMPRHQHAAWPRTRRCAATRELRISVSADAGRFVARALQWPPFAYGADNGGAHRRDDRLFSEQLAGEFLSRYSGWGDVIPTIDAESSIDEQLRTAVAGTPDFCAPKVWDPEMKRGVAMPGSRFWPFYLESYTAMAAIQIDPLPTF